MKKMMLFLLAGMMLLSLTACTGTAQTTTTTAQTTAAAAPAADTTFALKEGDEKTIESAVFEGNVVVTGDNAQIMFVGCTFKGDVINKAGAYTRVGILSGSTVEGKCILTNENKEGTIDTPLPKFVTDTAIDVVAEDCLGAVAAIGDITVKFNGTGYKMADANLFITPEGDMVEYSDQEASAFVIGQWWENGEQTIFKAAE